jgi:hypothetical protein
MRSQFIKPSPQKWVRENEKARPSGSVRSPGHAFVSESLAALATRGPAFIRRSWMWFP